MIQNRSEEHKKSTKDGDDRTNNDTLMTTSMNKEQYAESLAGT